MAHMGTLYLVSTPIGNLEDITLRALRVLREAGLIAAEDTRHTRRLLTHYAITTRCISYHEHNKLIRIDDILTALADEDVALVSDAGTPGLSDPGFELVRAVIAAGFPVSSVPGPNAPVAALVASGLPTDQFLYLGFLPRRSVERRNLFTSLQSLPATLVCFESPHRLLDTLEDALAVLGDRQVVVARELTKMHEEWLRVPISVALEHFKVHAPRGEFTLVIAGAPMQKRRSHLPEANTGINPVTTGMNPHATAIDALVVRERLHRLHSEGYSGSEASRLVARELGLSKRVVYQVWLEMAEPEESE